MQLSDPHQDTDVGLNICYTNGFYVFVQNMSVKFQTFNISGINNVI